MQVGGNRSPYTFEGFFRSTSQLLYCGVQGIERDQISGYQWFAGNIPVDLPPTSSVLDLDGVWNYIGLEIACEVTVGQESYRSVPITLESRK